MTLPRMLELVGAPRRRSYPYFLAITAMVLSLVTVLGVIAFLDGPGPFILGVIFALIPVPVLLLAVVSLDRYEPEPRRNLVFTFIWGAGAATLIALVAEAVNAAFLRAAVGGPSSNLIGTVIAAPVIEEVAKGLVLLGIFVVVRHELDGPLDGIVYAGAVGLGFAMTENVVYYAQVTADQGSASLAATFILRGLFSPFAHPLFTASTGICIGYASLSRNRGVRFGLPVLGLLIAVILHGIWNAAATAGIGALTEVYLVVFVPTLVAVLLVVRRERKRLRALIITQLEPYAAGGLIGAADVPMVASLSQRRRARSWAASVVGPAGSQAMRGYQLAATELALLEDRAARGTSDHTYALRRDALVNDVADRRAEFLDHIPRWPLQAARMWPR